MKKLAGLFVAAALAAALPLGALAQGLVPVGRAVGI